MSPPRDSSRLPSEPTVENGEPPPPLRAGPRPWWVHLGRILAVTLSAALFARVLWMANLTSVAELLARVGPLAVLAVVPYAVAVVIDTASWSAILNGLEARVSTWRLLGIRLSTEAVLLSFPGGPLIAEGLKPWFLSRRFGVGIPESTASLAVKKALQVGTQGIYLFVAAVVAGPWLAIFSRELGQKAWIQPALAGVGLLLCLVSAAMTATLLSGSVARRVWSGLGRIPSAAIRRWVVARERAFLDTDQHVRAVLRSHSRGLIVGAAWTLVGWFVDAVETWFLLLLLGIRLPYSAVLAFEPVVALARNLVFFIPAGLGVQDAGYMLFLQGFGIPDATNRAAAFVLLRRAKEIFWIVTGWVILFALRGRRHAKPPNAVTTTAS
jgi:glycosyltransferase 2 family protein